jgi:hypothetical protein
MKPPKWTDVYQHGTKQGDEELKFFISLARNPKFQWRSTSAIAKESGLTKERVEEIIQKYHKKNMVFQNPKNEDQYGYWERVPDMVPDDKKSISGKDQSGRVDKVVSKDMVGHIAPCVTGDTMMNFVQLKSGYGVDVQMKDNAWLGQEFGVDEWIPVADVPEAVKSQWIVTNPPVASVQEPGFANFAPSPCVNFATDGDRRVFYIDVEKMCAQKAEKFMENLKAMFKKKKESQDPEMSEHALKMKKLEELKLQVMAQNPQVMGVPMPSGFYDNFKIGNFIV